MQRQRIDSRAAVVDPGSAATRSRIATLRLKSAALRLSLVLKAGFDPNQPRVPRGNPRGGQWTRTGGSGEPAPKPKRPTSGSKPEQPQAAAGRNQRARLEAPPPIPKRRPATAKERTAVVKASAKWLARAAARQLVGRRVSDFIAILEPTGWLDEARPYIHAYGDAPRSLDELQRLVSTPAKGYDIHHIVERTPATQDGFSRSLIDAPDNLVRIPTLKHWEITAWYMTRNDRYGGVSPRVHLRGAGWSERIRVGREALIHHGVLKP